MQIQTKPFGMMDVDERQKVFFPYGILGFEDLGDYVLLDASQPPFYWLQSLSNHEVAFVLIDPHIFRPDYNLEIPEEDLEDLGIAKRDEMLVFAIVTIPEKQEQISANLQGPIIINKQNKLAKQCISLNSRWKVRHFILEELAAVKDRAC